MTVADWEILIYNNSFSLKTEFFIGDVKKVFNNTLKVLTKSFFCILDFNLIKL